MISSYSKSALRREALQLRAQGEEIDSSQVCRVMCTFLEKLDLNSSSSILSYNPLGNEVDLTALQSFLSNQFLVTRTDPTSMVLTIHAASSEMERSKYGFLQPVRTSRVVKDVCVQVVLVPGLLFDRSGVRLGFGKGYYDRLLARLSPEAIKVGVVGSRRFLYDSLPKENHDISMTHLAFEDQIVSVENS